MKDSILHIYAKESAAISRILQTQTHLETVDFNRLIKSGSIWVGDLRILNDVFVESGTYIRVHTDPRRYSVQNVDWMKTLVFEDSDFLVINKPAGIPVHATVDNSVENVLYQLEKTLRHPVYVTQRLDTPTSGLMVIAKTKWFQAQYNRLLKERSVAKTYWALTDQAVPTGTHTHFMLESTHAPKQIYSHKVESSVECTLNVLSCVKSESWYLSEIQLITGRTHQIRAQLSYLGTPIKGDHKYGSQTQSPWSSTDPNESIALRSFRLEFKHPAKQGDAAQCLFLLSDSPSGNVIS